MWKDPIVEDMRKLREQYACKKRKRKALMAMTKVIEPIN